MHLVESSVIGTRAKQPPFSSGGLAEQRESRPPTPSMNIRPRQASTDGKRQGTNRFAETVFHIRLSLFTIARQIILHVSV